MFNFCVTADWVTLYTLQRSHPPKNVTFIIPAVCFSCRFNFWGTRLGRSTSTTTPSRRRKRRVSPAKKCFSSKRFFKRASCQQTSAPTTSGCSEKSSKNRKCPDKKRKLCSKYCTMKVEMHFSAL